MDHVTGRLCIKVPNVMTYIIEVLNTKYLMYHVLTGNKCISVESSDNHHSIESSDNRYDDYVHVYLIHNV